MGKTGEIKKPAAANPTEAHGKKEGGGAPAHGGHAPSHGHGGGHGGGGGGKNVGAKVGCHAAGCKEKDHRYNFCDEHFRQFKFGLITKTGERVLDYERKLEHYQNWVKAQKVA
jgi:hypothetical protein